MSLKKTKLCGNGNHHLKTAYMNTMSASWKPRELKGSQIPPSSQLCFDPAEKPETPQEMLRCIYRTHDHKVDRSL